MVSRKLIELKRSYSSALYSFFRVTNLGNSMKTFFKDPQKPPQFKYIDRLTLHRAENRLRDLRRLSRDTRLTRSEMLFIERRIQETLVLRHFLRLRENPDLVNRQTTAKYLKMQEVLYGALDPELFSGIVQRLHFLAKRRGPKYINALKEIEGLLNIKTEKIALYIPKDETFHHYKQLFHQSFPELHKVLSGIRVAQNYSVEDTVGVLEQALRAVGAEKKGWKVLISLGGANVSVAKQRRIVMVGSHFHPKSSLGLKQIVAHEVGCHVQKALTEPEDFLHFIESEEGTATMLEQLLAPHFMYKRALRFFAICLATGLDGRQRNFSEVYEILQRATFIVTGDINKEMAFMETARVFRGGLPDKPGFAYIKDKIYLEENLIVWRQLEDNRLNLKEFKNLFNAPTKP